MSLDFQADSEGKIWVFTMRTSTREAADIWAAHYRLALKEAQEEGRPFYIICDFSSPNVGMTPYLRQRGSEILQITKPLAGYLAIVLATNFGKTAITLFLRAGGKYRFEWRNFSTPEQALAWMQGKINEPAP
jgi:hypothetical protein